MLHTSIITDTRNDRKENVDIYIPFTTFGNEHVWPLNTREE